MIDELALITGIDLSIPELAAVIHQPTILEISYLGEKNFFKILQFFCFDKNILTKKNPLLKEVDDFQIFQQIIEEAKEKNNVINFISLLFPLGRVMMTPNGIIISFPEQNQTTLIDKDNFHLFQEVLRQIFCTDSIFQGDNITYNPANEAARRIADRIMETRLKVAATKSKEQGSIIARYVSILTVGLHTSVQTINNMTFYQLFDIMERFNLFVEWDTDLRVRLVGGSPKEQAENWMKNIHNQGGQ